MLRRPLVALIIVFPSPKDSTCISCFPVGSRPGPPVIARSANPALPRQMPTFSGWPQAAATDVPGMRAIEQLCDGAVAVGFNIMRELAGTLSDEVLMSRRTPSDIRPYRRFFGVTPRFHAEQNALAFPTSLLARPIDGADRQLRGSWRRRLQTTGRSGNRVLLIR